jgi:hypothetical protein
MMSSHCHCSTNCQQMNRCQCKRWEWRNAFAFNM